MDKFDLNDFRDQLVQISRADWSKIIGKLSGMGQLASQFDGMDASGELKRIRGIIDSMTPAERADPYRIEMSRRRRIAEGSGVSGSDVHSVVKQFEGMAAMYRRFNDPRGPWWT